MVVVSTLSVQDSKPMGDDLYGIFGGTFDPIHNGHLETVAVVQKRCALKRVIFVPSAFPSHRNQPRATAKQRLEMVALAVQDYDSFDVDDLELRRKSHSYTYHTIKIFQQKFPNRQYYFIVGIDALLGLESWYKWRELLKSVHFVVMGRPNWRPPNPLPTWWQEAFTDNLDDLQSKSGGRIFEVDVKPNPVSATEIRYAISQGFDVGAMMPGPVWHYICANNLYSN